VSEPVRRPTVPRIGNEPIANEHLVARDGQVALQYGSAQGTPELREQICEVMAAEGIRADPNDVVVTVGSQMALDLVTRIYCDPGDVVLAEGPSYVGVLGSFAAYQAQVVHVAMDAHGWCRRCCGTRWARWPPGASRPSSATRSRTSRTRPA
jgi:DNA-binding transcriptional MocR family regulator